MNKVLCGIPVDDRSARELITETIITYKDKKGIKQTINLGFGATSGFPTKNDEEAGTLEVTTRTLAGRLGLSPRAFIGDIANPKAYQEWVTNDLGLIVDDLNNPFYKALVKTIPSLQTTVT